MDSALSVRAQGRAINAALCQKGDGKYVDGLESSYSFVYLYMYFLEAESCLQTQLYDCWCALGVRSGCVNIEITLPGMSMFGVREATVSPGVRIELSLLSLYELKCRRVLDLC